jgi:competence protein ComEC
MPPLVPISACWILGLVVAHHWLVPLGVKPAPIAFLASIPLVAGILWRRDRNTAVSCACSLALLAGALRFQAMALAAQSPEQVSRFNGSAWVTLEGVVRGYPDERDTYTNLPLAVDSMATPEGIVTIRGIALVHAPRWPAYDYGDRLRVSGKLEEPPETDSFSYRDYLARRGIYSLIQYPRIVLIRKGEGTWYWKVLYWVRARAAHLIRQQVPEPEGSLMQGIVLGIDAGIPRGLQDDLNATGTSHIVVISGSNITLLAAVLSRSMGRLLGKRRGFWLACAAIFLYVLLAGGDPAAARAAVMGSLYLTARHVGRRSTAYVALCASGVILTLLNPWALWDAGFQLSFSATLGMILFVPLLERPAERLLSGLHRYPALQSLAGHCADLLTITLAAQFLTTPVVLFWFGRLSVVAPLVNMLVVPVQPAIMAVAGLATGVGLLPILEPVAKVLFWLPWLGLAYTVTAVRWLARLPYSSMQTDRNASLWIVLAYTLILVGLHALVRKWPRKAMVDGRSADQSPGSALHLPLIAAVVLASLAICQLPDRRLHVTFLDVGQGDAVLITTPQGQQVLVDGGPSPQALTSALGREMPFWDRTLDLVIMTHPDLDHITGLAEVLDRYNVGGWLDNGSDSGSPLLESCKSRLDRAKVPRTQVEAGARLDLAQGIELEFVSPPPAQTADTEPTSNERSLVLRVSWKQVSFLLTGDIGADTEQMLVESAAPLNSTVLKVAHHGSEGSTTREFLRIVDPRFAVLSVGADNRSGHPAQATLQRLSERPDLTVLRTDLQGTVDFSTDGSSLWLRTQR